jgi:UDP-glucose:(heptosyl)LPS alpha-1,3-glucosyltransferase
MCPQDRAPDLSQPSGETARLKLRIGLIHQRYVSFGGAERYMDALVTGLLGLGHEVHVFAHQWDPGASERGVTLHRVPMLPGASWLKLPSFAWNCARAVRRAGCDVVLSLERTWQQDIYRAAGGCHRAWLDQRSRYSTGWRRLGSRFNPLHPVLLWMEGRTLSRQNTRGVIALSHQGRAEIRRYYPLAPEQIEVIHLGVDLDRYRPASQPLPDRPLILLLVGTGWERKGLEFAVRALARLPEHVRLRVYGKGRTAPYLRLADRIGCGDRIEFRGIGTDMPRVYQGGHLLVHPAIYEPFGNVCLEAMACGLPLVTSRITGASELIQQPRNGWVIEEPSDIPGLVGAIEYFLDPRRRLAAGRAARETAEAHPFVLNGQRTQAFVRRICGLKGALEAQEGRGQGRLCDS